MLSWPTVKCDRAACEARAVYMRMSIASYCMTDYLGEADLTKPPLFQPSGNDGGFRHGWFHNVPHAGVGACAFSPGTIGNTSLEGNCGE